MKLERVKNAKRNMAYGIINKAIAIFCPFVLRMVLIYVLGVEYLGLGNLFASILSVLSLGELGLGNAIVFSMYKPIAEEDNDTICSLLFFYKRVYRGIGCLILFIGLMLIPFLNVLIKDGYPEGLNIYMVYIIYLFNAVIGYFMYAYLSSLLIAYQREDIISYINSVITIAMTVSQIILLVVYKDYYLFSLIMPLFTILNNLRIAVVARKMFPAYECKVYLQSEILEDIKCKVKGAFIGKACNVSRNAFDSIFISAFLSLTYTAIYNNYYYIINGVTSFLLIICNSILGGVGNSVATETVEKNYSDMQRLNFLYMWISGWCTIAILCLVQPFMQFWMGTELMFPYEIVVLLCAYFYILKMGDIRTVYVQVNGLWWQNRTRSIIELISNLILNFILGKMFGIYGIIIATILTLFLINFGYGSSILFKFYFRIRDLKEYYFTHFQYMFITIIIAIITVFICLNIDTGSLYNDLLIKTVICFIVPNVMYYIAYRKKPIFIESLLWVKQVLLRR